MRLHTAICKFLYNTTSEQPTRVEEPELPTITETLARLQQGMPADKKAEHDAMTSKQAFEEARKLEIHATELDHYGVNTDTVWARVRYFDLLSVSKVQP